jgi:hypothetical protein
VTRIETWMRDPYDLYAERILKLTALDDLDSDPGATWLRDQSGDCLWDTPPNNTLIT